MYKIQLQAVDSREATQQELEAARIEPDQYPPDRNLMAHQVATIKAYRDGDAPIIINTALTGDGKSLAGQLPLFADQTRTLAMYPTNELALDQKRSLDRLFENWQPPKWRRRLYREVVNAAALDDISAEIEGTTRHEALNRLLDNDLVLTNPDIFHLIMQFGYLRFGAAPDLILTAMIRQFGLFIFDEFHLFDTPQTASAMMAILLALQIGDQRNKRRFLLLSATPESILRRMAGQVGLQVDVIEGSYRHGQAETALGYRRILQEVALHLDSGSLDNWVVEHFENTIAAFFQRNRPGAKGVIICNSVATAYRVHGFLNTVCDQVGIRVGINTGLTPRDKRNFDDVDLLVATSTVDVGVDFRINLLIFESLNASSHIQRLGRLGRHTTDGAGNIFQEFEAYGLLPQWVLDSLTRKILPDSTIDRESYYSAVQSDDVFPPQQSFDAYTRKWAGVQSSHILMQLSKKSIAQQYKTYRDALQQDFNTLFPGGYRRYKALLDNNQTAILDEARSFRGGSPFTALVQDILDPQREVIAYNLTTLLKNAELEWVDLNDMYDAVQRQSKSIKALERAKPVAGYRLHSWLPKPKPVEIFVDRDLDATHFNCVIESKRIRLMATGVQGMTTLNETLERLTLVTLLVRNQTPDTLRRMLRLGVQIELFQFTSRDGSRGTAVFGRDALLLDSVLFRFRQSDDCGPIIF